MNLFDMHPEDIRAALRKQYGKIRQFEIAKGLPRDSVHEVLRKRRWAKVERAIEEAIACAPNQYGKPDSPTGNDAHGLSAKAA